MNDEMRDIQPTSPAPPSATSSTSGELEHVTTLSDQVTTSSDQITTSSDQSGSPGILSVDDKIPLVRLSSNVEFTSFSELSKFLERAPVISSAFTKLYGKS